MMTGQDVFNYVGIDMGWVLIGAVGVCFLLLILIIVLFVQNSKLKKKYNSFMEGEDAKTLENVILERFQELDKLRDHIGTVENQLNRVDNTLLHTYKKMVLRRYDAFEEMGGSLSFVLVLLTASNDGFIINSMHSTREGCYIYAKNIEGGKCEMELSTEEMEALKEAVNQ